MTLAGDLKHLLGRTLPVGVPGVVHQARPAPGTSPVSSAPTALPLTGLRDTPPWPPQAPEPASHTPAPASRGFPLLGTPRPSSHLLHPCLLGTCAQIVGKSPCEPCVTAKPAPSPCPQPGLLPCSTRPRILSRATPAIPVAHLPAYLPGDCPEHDGTGRDLWFPGCPSAQTGLAHSGGSRYS